MWISDAYSDLLLMNHDSPDKPVPVEEGILQIDDDFGY